jgi:hypothetical protein
MQRVFPPSDLCAKSLAQVEKLVRLSAFGITLLLVIASAMPLSGQSDIVPFSAFQSSDMNWENNLAFDPRGAFIPASTASRSASALRTAPAEATHPLHSANFEEVCSETALCGGSLGTPQQVSSSDTRQAASETKSTPPDESVKASSGVIAQKNGRPDRNLDIYYRNRREFSLDVGWHPVNIPFIYDFAVGDSYNMTPLKYTLVPIIASFRWHVTNVGWRWIFRGNMDFTFSGAITAIPRGPETHYYSFDFGIRRNFVYRNWKVVPFFEQRGGAGIINAKEPLGVQFGQGQNLTFTYNLGVGARYNINSKYSFSGGMNYMHISNGYLSQPQFTNYGINVYGSIFGIDVRLSKPHRVSE